MVEVVEVDVVEAGVDVVVVAEVEHSGVLGSKDLEFFFLLKNGWCFGNPYHFRFHPFGISDG